MIDWQEAFLAFAEEWQAYTASQVALTEQAAQQSALRDARHDGYAQGMRDMASPLASKAWTEMTRDGIRELAKVFVPQIAQQFVKACAQARPEVTTHKDMIRPVTRTYISIPSLAFAFDMHNDDFELERFRGPR